MADQSERPPESLERARDVREDMSDVIVDVEGALAGPVGPDAGEWSREVAGELARLREAFDAHCEVTEGENGLLQAILVDAPRMQSKVRHLHADHSVIDASLAELERAVSDPTPDPEAIRVMGTELLGMLARHRQRGADAIYDAYSIDIGGE